nr:DNA methylase [Serratia proteamaculans]
MSRFLLGNCVQIMSEFPDNAVDFILTDPHTLLISVIVAGDPLPETKPVNGFSLRAMRCFAC